MSKVDAEKYNYNLASGETVEMQNLFENINKILEFKDSSDFNPNQKEAIMEMFFSDPKPGDESIIVLKRLFGDDYNDLGINNPDISPGVNGSVALDFGELKIIVENNGHAHVSVPREMFKEWKIFNAEAVEELKKILQGENKIEDIKNQATDAVDRPEKVVPIENRG